MSPGFVYGFWQVIAWAICAMAAVVAGIVVYKIVLGVWRFFTEPVDYNPPPKPKSLLDGLRTPAPWPKRADRPSAREEAYRKRKKYLERRYGRGTKVPGSYQRTADVCEQMQILNMDMKDLGFLAGNKL